MKLYCLSSSLHDETRSEVVSDPFIRSFAESLAEELIFADDFADYDSRDSIIYIRTGGTEGLFKSVFCPHGETVIPGGAPVRLLASGQSNSLAASMEILSWLEQQGLEGLILHGDTASPNPLPKEEVINEAVYTPLSVSMVFTPPPGQWSLHPLRFNGLYTPSWLPRLSGESNPRYRGTETPVCRGRATPLSGSRNAAQSAPLAGKRFGIIGKPSDWLISSDVDYEKVKVRLGCELVDVDIRELVDVVRSMTATERHEPPASLHPLTRPGFGRAIDSEQLQLAADVYDALKMLIGRYALDGLTLRCFDLLDTLRTTGCLALALLNSEGYVATCEGDIPAMLSMAVGRAVCGESGFQVNLSRAEGDDLLFAHCTIPLTMTKQYSFDTHFESGIGVAIRGDLEEMADATLFKLSADLTRFVAEDVQLLRSQSEPNLCRTQVWVHAPGLKGYLLHHPLGNHHILLPGHQRERLLALLVASH